MARRRIVFVVIGGALLGTAAMVVWQLGRDRSLSQNVVAVQSGGAQKPGAQPAASHHVRLAQARGAVEINRGNRGWGAARVGDELRGDDSIRAGSDAAAVLEVGDYAEVRMVDRSEFSVAEISQQVARVRLEQGRMAAAVRGGGRSKLVVQFRGSHAVAESVQGEFSALTDGRGLVSVAASAGQVRLSAQRGTVDVLAGQQSTVHGSQAPLTPTRIPPSLFLKVGRALPIAAGQQEVVLHGNTTPGALVSVNGRPVPVGDKGAFEARLVVKQGANDIEVGAEDALGRRETARQSFVLPAPSMRRSGSSDDLESHVSW